MTSTVHELELLQEVFSHRSDMSECSNKIQDKCLTDEELSTIFDKVSLSGISYPVGSFSEKLCQIDVQSDVLRSQCSLQVALC